MDSPLTIHIEGPGVTEDGNTILDNGDVVVQISDHLPDKEEPKDFFENLAKHMDPMRLGTIASDLIEAIESDDRSRQQWLENRKKGFELVGIQLEEPRSTVADTGSAMDGISSITNPLLLESILKGWANSRSELLPAEGPAKIVVFGDETPDEDNLAEALERDFNYYLTKTAKEYYPETSHMLLWGTYFGGSGFKKVYRCPLKRRPVALQVDAKDLIVSDAMKDFASCSRITHHIPMRPSVMKRMQWVGSYLDVELSTPHYVENKVDEKINDTQGIRRSERPEDQPYTVWECQCELDLAEYAPTQFKNEAIPLPYRVTIEKGSRQILALRRDWNEDDDNCERIQLYVKYPYIPGPGFYGTGMLGMLGNTTAALTAVDRECLDAGMLNNFPGGLIDRSAVRQNTSNFRAGPGEFIPIDTGNRPIAQLVAPFPYKDVSGGLMALRGELMNQAKEMAGSVEVPTGEGLANIPVGTMLTQVEQSTKVMNAAHKDMHVAQCEEFELLLELFRQYPEDFWRGLKADFWTEEKFLQAISDYKLVPRADPNVPSHIHRISKYVALLQAAQSPIFTPYFNIKELLTDALAALKADPARLLTDPQPQSGPGPDPAAMISAQAKQQKNQVDLAKIQADAGADKDDAAIKAAQLAQEQQIEQTRLAREEVIHAHDDARENMRMQHDIQMDHAQHGLDAQQAQHGMQMDHAQHQLSTEQAAHQANQAQQDHELNVQQANQPKPPNVSSS